MISASHIFLLCGSALAEPQAAEPAVVGELHARSLELSVQPPAGFHVAEEAPASLDLLVEGVAYAWSGPGIGLVGGVTFALAGPSAALPVEVDLRMTASMCTDDGRLCQPLELERVGRVGGEPVQLSPPRRGVLPGLDWSPESVIGAADGRPLLLDFSAPWCPPCQLLAADLLHDPADAAFLGAFQVVEVDADHPASFALKDRYAVGGYPTMVLARPDGTEIDRLVGYPGEAATRRWLTSRVEARPLGELSAMADEALGEAALRLAQAGREEEAARLVARALAVGVDDVDLAMARLQLGLEAREARRVVSRLLDEAPERLTQWMFAAAAVDLKPRDASALAALADKALAWADPALAMDLLYVTGSVVPAREAGAMGAVVAVARAARTGDSVHDRGYAWTEASALQSLGRVDEAVAVLDGMGRAFPGDFTWPFTGAGALTRAGRHAEALERAHLATSLAYGDQALRAAALEARVLRDLGRGPEALTLVRATLAAADRPSASVEVRTHRYLSDLEALAAELQAGVR